MKDHVKAYAWFVGFTVLTAIVVAPLVKNIPIVGPALNPAGK